MLNLRKLTMSTLHLLHQSKASTISLSRITSPSRRNVCRAFHETYLLRCSYAKGKFLLHKSSRSQVCTLLRIQGRVAERCLYTQEGDLKRRATGPEQTQEPNSVQVDESSTQTRCLHGDADRHDHRLQFAITQETNLCEGEDERSTSGSIHLIVGPMFAGKTTALLKRVEAEASAGRRVALVKSDKDTRYGLASIVSHDGRQMPCWAVSSLANFRSQIGEEEYAKLDLIGIDEGQFLKDLYSFCQVAADYEGKTLIVAGLDGDFQRNKFGSILDLVPLADSVVKLSSHCELCGKPASFTFRKTDNRNKEVIGGTDIYMPVCRQHYFSGKIAMEATRTVLDTHKFIPLQFGNA